jgi:hypothetical protein
MDKQVTAAAARGRLNQFTNKDSDQPTVTLDCSF